MPRYACVYVCVSVRELIPRDVKDATERSAETHRTQSADSTCAGRLNYMPAGGNGGLTKHKQITVPRRSGVLVGVSISAHAYLDDIREAGCALCLRTCIVLYEHRLHSDEQQRDDLDLKTDRVRRTLW